MNIKHVESVIRMRLCPKCSIGMTRALAEKVYRCDYTLCNETYDFSFLSDKTLTMLLSVPVKPVEKNQSECRLSTH